MILVGIAEHVRKTYAMKPLTDWIANAELPDADVLMRWHTGEYGEKDAVKTQREFFRRMAVDNARYNHLLFVGADTVPPLDILPKLLAHNLPVVGGLYKYRIGGEAVAWPKDRLRGGLVEVEGMGMDCVLFSRDAYEAVSFMDWGQSDDDYPYYDRLKDKGFKVMLDMDVACKHYETEDEWK